MSDNLNVRLLKQHAAILATAQTVNNVSRASRRRQRLWMQLAPVQDATDALAACEPRSVPALLRRN